MDDFSDLERLEDLEPGKGADNREKFTCGQCGGTGVWRPTFGTARAGKCYACKGSGFFLSSFKDRQKAKAQRYNRKVAKLADAQSAFNEANEGIIDALRGMTGWNNFAQSLVEQFNARGSLSEKQVASAKKMIAKCAATKAARNADVPTIDLGAIHAMFATVMETGHKKPKYRAEGVIITRAPDHGKNAGALYVKSDGGEYLGKITGDNKFFGTREAPEDTVDKLTEIAADPKDVAIRYGRKTGNCACCGRELTAKLSVELGIGPVCAENWGF